MAVAFQDFLPLNNFLYSIRNEENNTLSIYYGLHLIKVLPLDNKPLIYLEALSYLNAGIKKKQIASALGLDYSWLFKLIKIYKEFGVNGILAIKRGPEEKVTNEIKDFIVKEFKKLYERIGGRNFRDSIIEKIYKKYSINISYETLRQIIKPHKDEAREKRKNKQQELELKENENDEDVIIPEIVSNDYPEITKYGKYNRYAGLLLLNFFFENIPILKNFKPLIDTNILMKNIIILITYMFFISKQKIENYKELCRRELVEIIGVDKFKYPEDIRRNIRDNVNFETLLNINKSMLKFYIKAEELKSKWIFLDGHVVVYSGKKKILKTYHQQSNCPMKGRVLYFMHLSDGRPIYFEMNDCYNDFREIINKFIEVMKKIDRKNYKKYLYIFDRGGYSYEEFKYLKKKKIPFVVWTKNDKTDYKKENLDYEEFKIELKGNHIDIPVEKEYEVALIDNKYKLIDPDNKKKFIFLRKVVIKNQKKHTSFFTNDHSRSLSELSEGIIFRWRQERSFGVEVKDRGLNDINSYRAESFSEELIKELGYEDNKVKYVDTPEYKAYVKERTKLKSSLEKQQKELGKIVEEKISIEKLEKSKKYTTKISKIKSLKKEIEKMNDKINNVIQQIRKIDLLISKGIKRLDYTQKYFLDIIRVICAHIDFDMMKILSNYYKNRRDIFKLLDIFMLTGGYINNGKDGRIIVNLNRLNTKKENLALESFIEFINTKNSKMLFDNSKQISFNLLSSE